MSEIPSDRKISVGDVVAVLRYSGCDVIDEDDEIIVWKDDIKKAFPIEDGFVSKRFVQRIANKFDIPSHRFFHPEQFTDEN